jgi:hypothetical protein
MDEHPGTFVEEHAAADMPAPDDPVPRRMVTILYSLHRDIYKLPHAGKDLWLSVEVYPLADFGRKSGSGVGAIKTSNGGWRRAYRNWGIIQPGATATIPADDMMASDYLKALEA